MRAPVGEGGRECGLRVCPIPRRDPGYGSAYGSPPVGPNDNVGRERVALKGRNPCRGISDLDARNARRTMQPHAAIAGMDRRFEGGSKRLIGNVPAERVQIHLGGREKELGRSEQASGVVDDSDPRDRLRRPPRLLPSPKISKELDRAAEQAGRPGIRCAALGAMGRRGEEHITTGRAESERSRKPRGASADDNGREMLSHGRFSFERGKLSHSRRAHNGPSQRTWRHSPDSSKLLPVAMS